MIKHTLNQNQKPINSIKSLSNPDLPKTVKTALEMSSVEVESQMPGLPEAETEETETETGKTGGGGGRRGKGKPRKVPLSLSLPKRTASCLPSEQTEAYQQFKAQKTIRVTPAPQPKIFDSPSDYGEFVSGHDGQFKRSFVPFCKLSFSTDNFCTPAIFDKTEPGVYVG